MRLYLLTILFFSGVSLSLSAVIHWDDLHSLQKFGWYTPDPAEYGSGFQYNVPSKVRYSVLFINDLNPKVTGEGVWTGNEVGTNFRFRLNSNHFLGMKAAKLTLRVYTEGNGISLEPCGSDEECVFKGTGETEWMTVTFPIDVDRAKLEGLTLINRNDDGANFCIFDKITLEYAEEDSIITDSPEPTTTWKYPGIGYCNESCEYHAIDCHLFYTCINNKKHSFRCAWENGLAFNQELGVCDRIENVQGCRPLSCECGYMPNYYNCKEYYFCENLCRIETCEKRTCPGDMLWDIEFGEDEEGVKVQQCNLPQFARCAV